MSRTRKAFRYIMSDRWDRAEGVVYAPTASIARAELYRDLSDAWDVSWSEFLKNIASFGRWPARDVTLPERHELAITMDPKDLHVIVHAFGGDGPTAGNRAHFFTRAHDPQLTRLVDLGAFTRGRALPNRGYAEGDAYFILTDIGKVIAAGEQRCYEPWVEARHARKLASRRKEAA